MPYRARPVAVVMVAAGLALGGCADHSESSSSGDPAATLVDVPGSTLKQVVLTDKASERLGIQMQPIADQAGTQVIPYAALIYDAKGGTWVYTTPTPLTFVRTPVTVTNIAGDQAFLAAGPGAGTGVVTVGTAELYGAENKIGQSSGH